MTFLADDIYRHLVSALDEQRVKIDPADCWAYGFDNSRHHSLPSCVVFPQSHEEIRSVVQICHASGTPLIARGRGTGTTGASVPVTGGVILALERMNRILRIDADNRYAVVEPGVTNQALQDAVAAKGFFWGPDPSSATVCTVGGNLACNAAGPRAVKYGTTRDNVLGLRAVTGDGIELRAGVFTTKGVIGYDLTRLLIGSEGTLAIITEATLKLTPLPEAKRTLRVIYTDIDAAAQAVSRIMAQPITPCALEFMDGRAIELIRQYGEIPLPEQAGALLMVEVDGPTTGLDAAAQTIAAAASGRGMLSLDIANDPSTVKALWQARKALSPCLRKAAPKKVNEDVVVPVSRMPELIAGLEALSRTHGILIVNFGHAGNGNIHVNLLYDPSNPAQAEAAPHCLDAVFSLVLKLEGTLSGEHGVGIDKRDFVNRELTPETLELMARIKRQFDPAGILNPQKSLPATPTGATATPYSSPTRRL
ncbi:FAD-binding oxidoreductase [Alkalilimnicola ehrlichii]|uniref:FAD-binding oxidoreductase n=1 Tax=Alkalilimnicola ehrlichii TaxID=351052 RepID=A0A3E0WYK0_9GAMM|nr:FAD-binding oxidoreductase [Alkalilimnicola ehrlichii]